MIILKKRIKIILINKIKIMILIKKLIIMNIINNKILIYNKNRIYFDQIFDFLLI